MMGEPPEHGCAYVEVEASDANTALLLAVKTPEMADYATEMRGDNRPPWYGLTVEDVTPDPIRDDVLAEILACYGVNEEDPEADWLYLNDLADLIVSLIHKHAEAQPSGSNVEQSR
jgi:hypothetical protein